MERNLEQRARDEEFNQLWARMYPRRDRVAYAMIAVGFGGLIAMALFV